MAMTTRVQQVQPADDVPRTRRPAAPASAPEVREPLVRNHRDEWVPAIPAPRTRVRYACACGARFWTFDGYRGHYVLVHVMALESV